MKITGLFAIFIAFSLLGFAKSNNIIKRQKQISEIINLAEILKIMLTTGEKSLWQMIEQINSNNDLSYLLFLKQIKKDNNISFKAVWEDAIEATKFSLSLKEQEKHILLSFGGFLGSSETENQIKIIEEKISLFKIILDKAGEDVRQKSKLYRTLGILAGAAIVIFII